MQENEFEKIQSLRVELEYVEHEIDIHKRTLLRLERQYKKDRIKLVKSFIAAVLCLFLCCYFLIPNFIYATAFGVMFLYFFMIRFPYLLLRYLADSGVKGIGRIFFKDDAYCYTKDKQKTIVELVELEARRDVIMEALEERMV